MRDEDEEGGSVKLWGRLFRAVTVLFAFLSLKVGQKAESKSFPPLVVEISLKVSLEVRL